ncbi:thiamine pyrophosphate-dependent enzyme [Mycoplasmoides gallisepticum]|nr:thiamine pyrophosphate-dependent enzyme [Mycoplasmoides gallisepticum]QEX47496.1 transketolase [Mycoplasmoides gallisepticum]WGG23777.1 thiamine pyrophosphate-dependent enzyme [Mycoplasmoides gallisepticum]WGG24567.1 thiamine pyrophosphate-dependent enzyme [Mycoplasmoides gallisepticum]WGG25325.1 thiamine pyrophosphate-dependent enzyme [Mycoplasmoides gallisepticum]WVH33594.1 thiamine pyrophosphate-dependent enzyme [Mycoplasmoides gallisepticum]
MVIKLIYQNKPFPKNSNSIVNNFRFLMFDTVNNNFVGSAAYGFGAASYLYVLFRNYFVMDLDNLDANYNDKLVVSKQLGGSNIRACFYLLKHPDIKIEDLMSFSHEKQIRNLYDFSTYQPGYNLAYAVGLAIDAKLVNQKSHDTITNKIYCIVSAADLNSSYGLAALKTAANQELNNLIIIYDNNHFEERGENQDYLVTDFSSLVKDMGFKYINVFNGNNIEKLDAGFHYAVNSKKPVFIDINTIVGHGYDSAGTKEVIKSSLTQDQLDQLTKRFEYTGEEFMVLYETANDLYPNIKERVNKLKELIADQVDQLKQNNLVIPNYLSAFKDWALSEDQIDANQSLAKLKADLIRCQSNSVLLNVSDHDDEFEREVEAIDPSRIVLLGNWIELAIIIANAISDNKIHLPVINLDINLIDKTIQSLKLEEKKDQILYLVDNCKELSRKYVNKVIDLISREKDGIVLQPGTNEELKYSLCNFKAKNKDKTYIILPSSDDLISIQADKINFGGYELYGDSYATVNIVTAGSDLIKALDLRQQLLENKITARIVSVISLTDFDQINAVSKSVLLKNLPSYFISRADKVAWGYVLSQNQPEVDHKSTENTTYIKKPRRAQKSNNNKIKTLDNKTKVDESNKQLNPTKEDKQ